MYLNEDLLLLRSEVSRVSRKVVLQHEKSEEVSRWSMMPALAFRCQAQEQLMWPTLAAGAA